VVWEDGGGDSASYPVTRITESYYLKVIKSNASSGCEFSVVGTSTADPVQTIVALGHGIRSHFRRLTLITGCVNSDHIVVISLARLDVLIGEGSLGI
jgi:hypothetical protein